MESVPTHRTGGRSSSGPRNWSLKVIVLGFAALGVLLFVAP